MKCRHVQKRLQPFVDGVLEPHEVAAIEEHLSRCSACRAEVEWLRGLDAALSAEPTLDPPPHMAAAIVKKASARALIARRLLVPRWLEALTFAGVALGLIAATLIVLGMGGTSAGFPTLSAGTLSILALTVSGGLAAFGSLYYSAQV